MSKHQPLQELERLGQAQQIRRLSQGECLVLLEQAYRELGSARFRTILNIENMPLSKLRETSTKGSILQPGINALNEAGEPTEPTMGAFMDKTGLSRDEIHDLCCGCRGRNITGAEVANFILYLDK